MIFKKILNVITIIIAFYSVQLFALDKEVKILTLSDIHFDPFRACYEEKAKPCPLIQKLNEAPIEQWSTLLSQYDNQTPYYRFNTNYFLLNSSLQAAKKIAEQNKAQFVLVLGDFIGHDYQNYYEEYSNDHSVAGYRRFFKKTFEYLTYELNKTFPNIDIFPVIGNNDSYYGNYDFYPRGKLYQELQNMWVNLIKNKTNRTLLSSTFTIDGYYSAVIQANLRLIVLNTVIFSDKANIQGNDKAAWKELDWLHEQLIAAQKNQQKVFIALHIPPGMDIYANLEFRLFRLLDLWKLPYTKRFEAELKQFAPEIAGIFAGHLHTDWFQILTLSHVHRIPITGTPSISPIYGNDPGFKLYTYSLQNQRFVSFETFIYTHTQHLWRRVSYQKEKKVNSLVVLL